MSGYRIPFNKPTLVGSELRYIAEAVERGHVSGDGLFTKKCCAYLEQALGVRKALLTTSCTHALEMCALLLDVQPGDEVIVPSFAFVSTVNAFVLRGARPIFVDIRRDTLNLDETRVRERIASRTKAIVALHYAGVGCEMDDLMGLSRETGVPVVEDNAHGLFGTYRGRLLGTFGALAAHSFHETKNLNCGEGGALLINDPVWIERAEIVREKGTDRARFFRGEVERYSWVDLGSSYLPSDILAAFLWAQLEAREAIQSHRASLWRRYQEGLSDWARSSGVGLPVIPEHCVHPHHMFYLILPTTEARGRLIDHLGRLGILAVFHYLPLHLSEMGRRLGGRFGDCPVTEDITDRLLRLPLSNGLTEAEQDEVIAAVCGFSSA